VYDLAKPSAAVEAAEGGISLSLPPRTRRCGSGSSGPSFGEYADQTEDNRAASQDHNRRISDIARRVDNYSTLNTPHATRGKHQPTNDDDPQPC